MSEQEIGVQAAFAELRAINNGLMDRCAELAAANAVSQSKITELEKAAAAAKGEANDPGTEHS